MLAPGEFAVRTAFLVDGFNLYHSSQDASIDLGGAGTKWLDLESLCRSFLGDIRGGAELESIDYFSALATFKERADPRITDGHRLDLECLRARGVRIHLGSFMLIPCRRFGFDLNAVATRSSRMRAKRLLGHQFPDPVRLQDGSEIGKPPDW